MEHGSGKGRRDLLGISPLSDRYPFSHNNLDDSIHEELHDDADE